MLMKHDLLAHHFKVNECKCQTTSMNVVAKYWAADSPRPMFRPEHREECLSGQARGAGRAAGIGPAFLEDAT